MVPPVRGVLQRAQVEYDYVNIMEDAVGAAHVKEINNGNASVPTLVFPDGSTLTEPSTAVLQKKLAALGYIVLKPTIWQALTDNPFNSIIGGTAVLFGLYDMNWVFVTIGLAFLAYTIIVSRQ